MIPYVITDGLFIADTVYRSNRIDSPHKPGKRGSDVEEAISVLADRTTPNGSVEGSRLLRLLSQLGGEDAHETDETRDRHPAAEALYESQARLSNEDEQLLARLRAGLARLSRSHQDRQAEPSAALRAALDGAELVARTEIVTGNSRRLPELLPGLAFLVVLQGSGEAEARCIAERAALLLAHPA